MCVKRLEPMGEDEIREIHESKPSLSHLRFITDDQTVDGLWLALPEDADRGNQMIDEVRTELKRLRNAFDEIEQSKSTVR